MSLDKGRGKRYVFLLCFFNNKLLSVNSGIKTKTSGIMGFAFDACVIHD